MYIMMSRLAMPPTNNGKNPKTAEVCSQILDSFKCVYFFQIRIKNESFWIGCLNK